MATAQPRTPPATATPTDLLGLHLCRTLDDLQAGLAHRLAGRLDLTDYVLALYSGPERRLTSSVGRHGGTDWPTGEELDLATVADWSRFAVHYRAHELGTLFVADHLAPPLAAELHDLLAHFGAALANLTISAESRAASEHYCASLQAFEEGIVLFQESDRDAVLARLLSLVAAMVHAPAGALFVLEEAGNISSTLELALAHGMPESLVESLRGVDDTSWQQRFLADHAFLVRRATDATLGGLDPASVPPVVHSILSVPLRYLGVDTGLCVLFNVDSNDDKVRDLLDRVTSFGRLGAAVLHRLHLEAISANQRSIQKELQIAAAIQERLQPRAAPAIPRMEFAWHSLSANNIGGDYLDLVASDLGDLCAIIADASGHGINSALLMSSFRSTYRAEAPWLETAALCQHLNSEVVHEVGSTGMFITAAALRIDRRTLVMSVSSAGHNPLLLYRRATEDIVTIDAHGPPLGFAKDGEFGGQTLQLAAGDVLLLYTDGVTEACNTDYDMFGDERLTEVLRRTQRLAPDQILQAVLTELAAFTGRNRYDDDVSLSIVKITD